MSINFGFKDVAGFDKELLYNQEGYFAKPVTISKSTLAVTQDDNHYIIPQGTYLYGANGTSLLLDPNQEAVAVVPTVTKATATINTSVVVTAKEDGAVAYEVELVVGTSRKYSVVATKTKATVTLAVDKSGNVTNTYGDVVKMLNDDIVANNYIVAAMADGVDKDTVAAAGTGTTAGGSASTTVASDIDGILLHSVDVADGEAVGTMMISGYVNIDNMPVQPGAEVQAKLPNIHFLRRD